VDPWTQYLGQQISAEPWLNSDPYNNLGMDAFLARGTGQLPYMGWADLADAMNSLYSQLGAQQRQLRLAEAQPYSPLLGGGLRAPRQIFNPDVRLDPSQFADVRGIPLEQQVAPPSWRIEQWRNELPWWQQPFPWERR